MLILQKNEEMLTSPIFVIVAVSLLTGTMSIAIPSASALSGSNDKCVTESQRDKSSYSVGTACGPDKSTVDAIKDQCKQTDNKCNSSQTGQGTFSNNPNKPDNGGGITEKFAH